MSARDYRAPASVERVQRRAWFVGSVALLLAIFGAITSPDKFYQSYLFSYLWVLGLTLGSLGLLMLQHLTGGNWGIIIRRPLEAATQNIWLVLLMFVPVVLGMSSLYRAWMDPDHRKAEPLSPLQERYLTSGGFLVRAVIYFAIWSALVWIFNKWSRRQDVDQENRTLRRQFKRLAGPGIILYVVAMTFASIDWVMSLSPHWASTIYGFIFVAGQAVSAMSLMIAVVVLLSGSEPFASVLQKRHLHDLGKLLFAFNMLWAYFDFSQLLIIWSGNLPEEITYYRSRLNGGWGVIAVVVLLFHFAVGKAHLPQPFDASDFKPDEIVGVVHHAHAVGLGVAHADLDLALFHRMHSRCQWGRSGTTGGSLWHGRWSRSAFRVPSRR